MTGIGLSRQAVIAILNTRSEINPCHLHFRQRAGNNARGSDRRAAVTLEMPAIGDCRDLHEPSPLMYRKTSSRLEAEELLPLISGRWRGFVMSAATRPSPSVMGCDSRA